MANFEVMNLLCGGTLDVTIIETNNSNDFKIISMGDNFHFGGRNFDWLEKELMAQGGKVELNSKMTKKAKEFLGHSENAGIWLIKVQGDTLIQQKFERLSQEIKGIVGDILKRRILEKHQIYFVESASKMPLNSKLPIEYFAPTFDVLHATQLSSNFGKQSTALDARNLKIQDTLSRKIGIEISGNKFQVVFEKNCPYGESKIVTFSKSADNQNMCEIPVYEGLSDELKDNRFIGSVILRDLPNEKAGDVKVDVRFEVDKNGIISVSAFGIKCELE